MHKHKEEITTIYYKNKGRYGYRRITDVLWQRKNTLESQCIGLWQSKGWLVVLK